MLCPRRQHRHWTPSGSPDVWCEDPQTRANCGVGEHLHGGECEEQPCGYGSEQHGNGCGGDHMPYRFPFH